MKLGVVGLGGVGSNAAWRRTRDDHGCVGCDVDSRPAKDRAEEGPRSVRSSHEIVDEPPFPRTMWLIVQADVVEPTVRALAPMLAAADAIVDGGNRELYPYEFDLADVAEPVPW